jgi:hypothetical protein
MPLQEYALKFYLARRDSSVLKGLFSSVWLLLISLFILGFFFAMYIALVGVDDSYLRFVKDSSLKLSRSVLFISIIASIIRLAVPFLCGFLYGQWSIKSSIRSAVRFDSDTAIGGLVLVPFLAFLKAEENIRWMYKDNFVLVIPQRKSGVLRGTEFSKSDLFMFSHGDKLTIFNVIIALLPLILAIDVFKNYYMLRSNFHYHFILLLWVLDFSLLIAYLVLGNLIGKDVIKQKISCRWRGKTSYIFDGYLCTTRWTDEKEFVFMRPVSRFFEDCKKDEPEKVFRAFGRHIDSELREIIENHKYQSKRV